MTTLYTHPSPISTTELIQYLEYNAWLHYTLHRENIKQFCVTSMKLSGRKLSHLIDNTQKTLTDYIVKFTHDQLIYERTVYKKCMKTTKVFYLKFHGFFCQKTVVRFIHN